jgi:hypothetical protein
MFEFFSRHKHFILRSICLISDKLSHVDGAPDRALSILVGVNGKTKSIKLK